MKMNLTEIAQAVNAINVAEISADIVVSGVGFDSRNVQNGDIFVPLVEQRDGHDFIDNALGNGAVATFVDVKHADTVDTGNGKTLIVPDTLAALWNLAKYYLRKVNPQVVAITGSNGKTTVKDMTASVLSTQYNVAKTPANLNNEIGVPVTVLNMQANTEILVVELGMDRPGQIDKLSSLVQPDCAVITMIGEAHIEFFNTKSAIGDAKMEIINHLNEDGLFITNGDDPILQEKTKGITFNHETFGISDKNTIYATQIKNGLTSEEFTTNLDNQEFTIPVIGDYNVENALAAILVGKKYFINEANLKKGLSDFKLTQNRTEWLDGANGIKILSDVYNSNPTASREVLNFFSKYPTNGERIVVFGDMLELGIQSETMHRNMSEYFIPEQLNKVYLYGSEVKPLYEALESKFGDNIKWFPANQKNELIVDLKNNVNPNDVILLKASHGMHLEDVVSQLAQQ